LALTEGESNNPLDVIIEAVSTHASNLTLPRLPEMIRTSFEMDRVILLLDGMDELPPEPMGNVVNYIEKLLNSYPEIRVVVTATATYFKGLPPLGFAIFPVAAWGYKIQARFIQRWQHLWNTFIVDNTRDDGIDPIDPLLLNGWLLNLDSATTPLDFTLKIWSAYARDTRGPRGSDGLEAYIQRLSMDIPNARITMELLASKILQNMTSTFSENEAKSWISIEFSEAKENDLVPLLKPDSENQETTVPRVLSELTQNGLLSIYSNRKMGFVHPVIAGYLAGFALTLQSREEVSKQPSWSLKDIATTYMTYLAGMGAQARNMLADDNDLFLRDRLVLGRRLPNLPQESSERKLTQQQLSSDLQNEKLPMSLRIRTLTALVMSRDPGILALFHHLMSSEHSNVRQLAVLGCGYLRDDQALGDLVNKLNDVINVGQAACLALANIGTKPALEAVTSVLLQGSEQMRQAAAESFATHPAEGYPILKEGSKVDDLLVRKAVIYGLRRVKEVWAIQILEEMRINDPQWVVKDSAAQAVEDLNNPDPCIPRPQPELEDLPWLIQFASDRGLGISKGKPAREMLLRVLSEGNEEEILAALGQIRYRGEPAIFPGIYQIFYERDPEISERAYFTIWYVASMGIEIPPYKNEFKQN
jgi:HEAT repeat protein